MATYQQLYDAVTQAGPALNRAIVAVAFAVADGLTKGYVPYRRAV